MNNLKKEDLKEDEFYSAINHANKLCVFKHKNLEKSWANSFAFVADSNEYFFQQNGIHYIFNELKLATPEEKYWLNECIRLDKFISKEDALKTFVPEYIECIKIDGKMVLNTIYKVKESRKWEYVDNDGCNTVIYVEPISIDGPFYLSYFKPSTKEAYDAQFVTELTELPEIWWIKPTNETLEILQNWLGHKSLTLRHITGMCRFSNQKTYIQKSYNVA